MSLAASLAAEGDAAAPVVLVTNGACGNLNPPFHHASREQVFAWGRSVADTVADDLRTARPMADPTIRTQSAQVLIPMDWHEVDEIERIADHMIRVLAPATSWPVQFAQAATTWRDTLKPLVAAGGGRFHDIEIQAARLGDVRIVAVNGELFSRFTDDLRRAVGDARVFAVGYANAAFGYLPTREAYAEGGYEVDTAHFFYNSFRPQPGALELLHDRAAELVRFL